MLIPLSSIIKKHNLRITGIIHVGANSGQEHSDYLKENIRDIVYIEASKASFYHLCRKPFDDRVKLFNIALADKEGEMEMYTETANQGQSSSLLKPGTHTTHYPGIKFTGRETVSVTTLDKLPIEREKYNMLNIDVQGAELLVLKGSKNTLEGIDIIYTEVNTEEVYEGCAKVDEIDALLTDFNRVETVMTGQGWGDALYLRKPGPPKIVNVPEVFKPKHPFPYPPDNTVEFERWFYLHTKSDEIGDRVYLPIFWTAYYVKFKYGKDKFAAQRLQIFLNKLDRKKKYFTIVQYDDGILHDVSHLDLKIFSMGGGRVDYPLPLICEPHKFEFPGIEKDIFCSFVGTVTHPIRAEIIKQLSGKEGYYISTKLHSLKDFCKILARSKYVLAPRGYGKTSFRIMEALQYGAVPIYISDEFCHPHHFKLGERPYHNWTPIPYYELLEMMKEQTWDGPQPIPSFKKYFTYQANKKIILENL